LGSRNFELWTVARRCQGFQSRGLSSEQKTEDNIKRDVRYVCGEDEGCVEAAGARVHCVASAAELVARTESFLFQSECVHKSQSKNHLAVVRDFI
jgi:hypothetical protein